MIPPPCKTLVLHLPGAGQLARVDFILLASWSPGVVGIKIVVVKFSFPHLYQVELFFLPPVAFIWVSRSSFVLNILGTVVVFKVLLILP